jgi:hypothetical protein
MVDNRRKPTQKETVLLSRQHNKTVPAHLADEVVIEGDSFALIYTGNANSYKMDRFYIFGKSEVKFMSADSGDFTLLVTE